MGNLYGTYQTALKKVQVRKDAPDTRDIFTADLLVRMITRVEMQGGIDAADVEDLISDVESADYFKEDK